MPAMKPSCPICRSPKNVKQQGKTDLWVCTACGALLDTRDDDGSSGDYSSRDPAARMMREERERERRRGAIGPRRRQRNF